MARCDTSLHDAGIELESIQAFFNDTTRRDVMRHVYCEPALSLAITAMYLYGIELSYDVADKQVNGPLLL